jgi:hypothetical protein
VTLTLSVVAAVTAAVGVMVNVIKEPSVVVTAEPLEANELVRER